jgi:putative transposase
LNPLFIMPQSLARLCIHLVFSTKNRAPILHDYIRSDLHAYMATTLKNLDCPALIINSVDDHAHVFLSLGRTIPVSQVVENLKKSSSKWIKTQGEEFSDFSWQAGYGAFSVSESNVPAVREYIESQAEHHRTVSFQDEYRAFLNKHGIHFDERYVWD